MTAVSDRSTTPATLRAPPWASGILDTPANIVITLAIGACAIWLVWPVMRWALFDATWTGTAADCRLHSGACWAFVAEKARFIVFGLYPPQFTLQAVAASAVVVGVIALTAVPRFWHRALIAIWLGGVALAIGLMSGAFTGNPVPTNQWSGLPLTLLIAVIGFAAAFPLGVLLAFGRRSRMLVVRGLSVAVIEVVRGVPLIAVLYFSTLLLPLMLPTGWQVDKLLRAEIAIILFVAAYIAEIVRSGFRAVPPGQDDAAAALGLRWWARMRLIVLPQALRAAIPSFVNLGIGLFLDTTLVTVIGLLDFLNTARTAASDPNWIGFYNEGFFVAAVVYFVVCFGGSRYSLWLERYLRRDAQRAVRQPEAGLAAPDRR